MSKYNNDTKINEDKLQYQDDVNAKLGKRIDEFQSSIESEDLDVTRVRSIFSLLGLI